MIEASVGTEPLVAAFSKLGVRFRLEEPLARYTTLGVGGPAEVMVFPASAADLESVLQVAASGELPVLLLGAGSNLLVADSGVRAVVVHTGALKIVRFLEGGQVEVEAGANFPALVRAAATRGLRGLEAGVGIPGSLGGVLAMNAGAYGFSIGDWVEEATVVTRQGRLVRVERSQMDFRYRTSSLGSLGTGWAVAGCRLQLAADEPGAVWADVDKHMAERKATQPVGVKSAGCIFKNPPGESAGRLIDALGLKGLSVGGARVSEVHGNFIVHDGAARAVEVSALIEEIKSRVYRVAGIELEEEVKRWS